MTAVAIVGAGQVGRSVARLATTRGFDVTLVDTDPTVVEAITQDPSLQDVTATTAGSDAVRTADVIVSAVPTPIDTDRTINLDAIDAVTTLLGRTPLQGDPLYIVESTIPPGTVADRIVPALDSHGLDIGTDIFVAHAPERLDLGHDDWPLSEIPRVVGAVTPEGQSRALSFYERLLDAQVHPVDRPAIAEASKVVENTYRDINIAYVNELALMFESFDIDITAVLDAAETKPFGFTRFSPGVGVGGHCIPIDPYFLIDEAEKRGVTSGFLRYAREVNDGMPEHVASRIETALAQIDISPEDATCVLLGLAFKPRVRDTRNSPAITLEAALADRGVAVDRYDPMLPESSTVESAYDGADVVVLVTAHEEFRDISFERLAEAGTRILVDGRNIYDKQSVSDAGLRYVGVGR